MACALMAGAQDPFWPGGVRAISVEAEPEPSSDSPALSPSPPPILVGWFRPHLDLRCWRRHRRSSAGVDRARPGEHVHEAQCAHARACRERRHGFVAFTRRAPTPPKPAWPHKLGRICRRRHVHRGAAARCAAPLVGCYGSHGR
eukprot:scaffold232295_cov30-Tisochrysis_lutea.AAC.2